MAVEDKEKSLIDKIKSTGRTFKLDLDDAFEVLSNLTMTTTNVSTEVQDINSLVNENVQAFLSREASTRNAQNTPQEASTGTGTRTFGAHASSRRSWKRNANEAKHSKSNKRSAPAFCLDCGSEDHLRSDEYRTSSRRKRAPNAMNPRRRTGYGVFSRFLPGSGESK